MLNLFLFYYVKDAFLLLPLFPFFYFSYVIQTGTKRKMNTEKIGKCDKNIRNEEKRRQNHSLTAMRFGKIGTPNQVVREGRSQPILTGVYAILAKEKRI